MNEFIQRLKQRKLVQWAVAYVAAAFALLQGLDIVANRFDLPSQTIRLVILAMIVGFFVTLILAWYHGERGQQKVSGRELLIIGLVLAIGGGILWRFAAISAAMTTNATSGNEQSGAGVAAIPVKSIAVLPFENLSEDKSNTYFADGMQDEIITRLAKIGELKVISRSSTLRYRSKAENVAEIGRQLGVAHVVEASVQKAGERIRINVQLIEAQSDEHLWAELYDRHLTDIFAVQSELATRIAASLQATLNGAERKAVAQKPTSNLEAYDAYLHGLDLFLRPGQTEENQRKAATLFAEATKLDPQFALAWAALSQANASLYFLQFDTSAARKEAARVATEKATQLDPSAIETLLANAYYRYHVERDYEGARLLFQKIQREAPSNSEALTALARIARRESRWNDSVRLYEQAAKLNPRDTYLCTDRAWTFTMLRQFAASAEMLARALEIAPDDPEVLVTKVKLLQATGDLTGARVVLARIPPDATGGQAEGLLVTQLLWEGNYEEAVRTLESWIERQKTTVPDDVYFSQITLGDAQSLAGKKEKAQEPYLAAKAGFERLRQEQPESPFVATGLAFAEAGLGNKEAALREAERAVSLLPAEKDPVFGPGMEENLAAVEAHFGELERAFARVERLLTTPYGAFPITLTSLRLDPIWIPLRQHPRFQALVAGPEPKTIYE